ncbi:unnamed protein product [Dicrocoelium dendriticum]|nr:unnamed protein product [Dicrocoelium dendriticum]
MRPHGCERCGKCFSTKFALRGHFNSVHLKQRPYTCEHCRKSFSEKAILQRHHKSFHSKDGHSASNHTAVSQEELKPEA